MKKFLVRVLNSMIAYKFVLAKHDAIASGSPLPPQAQVRNNISIKESEKQDLSTPKPAEATVVQNAPPSENNKRSAPVLPEKQKNVAPEEDDEEEDDFALLARRHSKVRADVALTESNALVPVDVPTSSVRTKEQDMIDLLSITLSTPTLTEQTPQQPPSPSMQQTQGNIPSNYPVNNGLAFNNYIAPCDSPSHCYLSISLSINSLNLNHKSSLSRISFNILNMQHNNNKHLIMLHINSLSFISTHLCTLLHLGLLLLVIIPITRVPFIHIRHLGPRLSRPIMECHMSLLV
ncbi:PREDICTED: uncharacterized protein LOC105974972 [Erythranthe guttata]|uniref:uncharacterized protein LOC105974972 n=1 Tax=Erythranthe guttata TaxID=4155 RepID=UPI00064D9182|nr:PREDICTED: uncharacterized protein LOC105974972 [Erythranthe guttata]|eukprot:XP_012855589.1 PREDICTED: uncharacterized protein LOC105974972 [Erythranthe guttata]